MIRLRVLSHPRYAQAFVDYMATLGVQIEMQPTSAHSVELWLLDEQQLPLAENELERFLTDPNHSRYAAASWQSGNTRNQLKYPSFSFWQILKQGGGWVTHSVAWLCIVVYLLFFVIADPLFNLLAFPADEAQSFEIWRFLTPALMHFSIEHILFNLVMWWYLAGRVERILGSNKLLQITLLSAVISAYAQSLYSGIHFGGLSGVVYALTGYVWLLGERVPQWGLQLPRMLMVMIIAWFFIDYFDLLGPVGNAAHFSGLVLGLLWALFDSRRAIRG